jgi:nucleotide-binding universal stress UspA family protein
MSERTRAPTVVGANPRTNEMDRTLVVGFDGSAESRRALDYAASRVNRGKLFAATVIPQRALETQEDP